MDLRGGRKEMMCPDDQVMLRVDNGWQVVGDLTPRIGTQSNGGGLRVTTPTFNGKL